MANPIARGSAAASTFLPWFCQYDGNRMGPEYCLKMMNDCYGDWQFRWLELFLTEGKVPSKPDSGSLCQHYRLFRSGLKHGSNLLQRGCTCEIRVCPDLLESSYSPAAMSIFGYSAPSMTHISYTNPALPTVCN
jgi:hypothetical protein